MFDVRQLTAPTGRKGGGGKTVDKRDLPGPHFDTTAAFNTFFELDGIMATKKPITIRVVKMNQPFSVLTLEGWTVGKPGDYLAEGVEGELYPIAADVFPKTFEVPIAQPGGKE